MKHDPTAWQGRGVSPKQWAVIDAIICAIGFGLIVWVYMEAMS
jgi:hypothetical protein